MKSAFFGINIRALLLGAAFAASAVGGPITVDDPLWYEFSWSGLGAAGGCDACTPSSGGNSQFADAPPWTFVGPAVLTVTDAFLRGDQFEVFNNLVSLGFTSAPFGSGTCGSDPVTCLADPSVSSGVFVLGPGAHSITINQLLNDFSGAGYFRVDSTVPEPSTWLLMGGSLLGLGLLRRRKP